METVIKIFGFMVITASFYTVAMGLFHFLYFAFFEKYPFNSFKKLIFPSVYIVIMGLLAMLFSILLIPVTC
jgi:hypothetical protein